MKVALIYILYFSEEKQINRKQEDMNSQKKNMKSSLSSTAQSYLLKYEMEW